MPRLKKYARAQLRTSRILLEAAFGFPERASLNRVNHCELPHTRRVCLEDEFESAADSRSLLAISLKQIAVAQRCYWNLSRHNDEDSLWSKKLTNSFEPIKTKTVLTKGDARYIRLRLNRVTGVC
jgi:hypothetical protein